MSLPPFLDRLAQGALLADGAMGTSLHQTGLPVDTCFDELNLTDPARVAGIHRAFIEAGAELIEANTFSANRYKLAEHGLAEQVAEINRAGVELAWRVVAATFKPIYVAGSVGPLGVHLAPFGRVQPEQALAAFREQIAGQVGAGVQLIILETFSDAAEIALAIRAAREVDASIAVIAQMTFTRDERTLLGDTAAQVAHALQAAGADVIGVNCSGGPAQVTRALQAMRQAAPAARLSAMPNAGWPASVGGRMMYPAAPEYFGDYALIWRDLGAVVIGGCCGTTPNHIRAMRAALSDPARRQPTSIHSLEISHPETAAPPDQPTELARKLAATQFVVTVEMTPPRGFTAQKVIAAAELLREAGADAINVSDSPMARLRMSPWAVCHLIQDRLGIETLLHFPTRGRNLLRVQGDLLAAHALNVRNIFVVMGDPTGIGDYPTASNNYDVVPSGLVQLIKQRLNRGVDQAGNSIGQPTSFLVGCALNLNAPDPRKEASLLHKKIEAGADFALTQPIFEPVRVEIFRQVYEAEYGLLGLPVLAGVLPLYNARHAAFLHNEVPGIHVPQLLQERMARAGEDAAREGVHIARQLLLDLKGLAQGAYLMPAFGRYELAADVLDALHGRV